ncbi:MAG: hypothetical protein ACLFSV_13215, partial [Alkalispirochaeta sp.]
RRSSPGCGGCRRRLRDRRRRAPGCRRGGATCRVYRAPAVEPDRRLDLALQTDRPPQIAFTSQPGPAFDLFDLEIVDNLYRVLDRAEMARSITLLRRADEAPYSFAIESGESTGWMITDWIEDRLLLAIPLERYDAWSRGQLSFRNPVVEQVVTRTIRRAGRDVSSAEIWLSSSRQRRQRGRYSAF